MCSLSKPTIDADHLRGQLRDNSVRVIDVRRAEDYKKDHIPKSVNLPLAELLADDSPDKVLAIAQRLGIDDQTPVVVYDDTFWSLGITRCVDSAISRTQRCFVIGHDIFTMEGPRP